MHRTLRKTSESRVLLVHSSYLCHDGSPIEWFLRGMQNKCRVCGHFLSQSVDYRTNNALKPLLERIIHYLWTRGLIRVEFTDEVPFGHFFWLLNLLGPKVQGSPWGISLWPIFRQPHILQHLVGDCQAHNAVVVWGAVH